MLCKNCNAEMPDNVKFCGKCGTELVPEADDPAQNQNGTERTTGDPDPSQSGIIPDEDFDKFLKKWNWGAFSFTWLWGIFNKSFNTFITFIPVVGIFYCFVCGAKGSRWSWKNKAWGSKDAFIKSQKRWNRWGIVIFVTYILLIILSLSLISSSMSYSASDSLGTQMGDSGINVIDSLTDQVRNFIDADNEYVQRLKNSSHDLYPGKTYGDAFDSFFGNPAWVYFDGTSGEKVVEFSGLCMYQDVEVKAVLQFVISQDEQTFTAYALSFNDVPQDQLTITVLLKEHSCNESK